MRSAPSAATATARSAGSSERSSNRSCETRIVWMLRTRSPWKSSTSLISSSYMMGRRGFPSSLEEGWRRRRRGGSPPPLEIQIPAHREQPLEALLHHLERRAVAEAAVGRAHPAVGEVAVVREEYSQRLVDAEQVPGAREQVGAVAEGLALAVAGDGRARSRR